MVITYKKLCVAVLMLFCAAALSAAFACDDTLIVLLTAQNPSSEFAKTIRGFNSNLATLGSALKEGKKSSYDTELGGVMKAWLEFSKTYMTNPPEEAKNDRAWVQKTTYAAKSIGEIRHDILKGSFYEAHNKVLALSGYLAKFFEGFGISEEKQIFMTASTNLISLERALLENNRAEAASFSSALKTDLSSFDTMLKGDNGKGTSKARSLLAKIDAGLKDSEHLKRLDGQFVKLQAVFEEMRSEILLQEWFPSAKKEGGKQ